MGPERLDVRDPDTIRGWQRLDAATTTSGRIEAADVDRLAALGTRHVVNLALDDHPEALADEASLLAARGIAYTHIPVPFDAPDEAHFAAFEHALSRAGPPVHVHCIMNWRVSAFFYRRNIARGMEEAAARGLLHEHWAPETSDDPRSAVWARFIGLAD